MNNTIICRPYRLEVWGLPVMIFGEIFMFVLAGYFWALSDDSVFFLTGLGAGCIWLTKIFYDRSKIAVFLEEKGLRILGRSYLEYRYMPWEELTYAYYTRDYKGHLYFVLSSNAVSHKEAKRFVNRAAWSISPRICNDGVVVIFLDFLQDVSQLKGFIESHVLHVDTYCT